MSVAASASANVSAATKKASPYVKLTFAGATITNADYIKLIESTMPTQNFKSILLKEYETVSKTDINELTRSLRDKDSILYTHLDKYRKYAKYIAILDHKELIQSEKVESSSKLYTDALSELNKEREEAGKKEVSSINLSKYYIMDFNDVHSEHDESENADKTEDVEEETTEESEKKSTTRGSSKKIVIPVKEFMRVLEKPVLYVKDDIMFTNSESIAINKLSVPDTDDDFDADDYYVSIKKGTQKDLFTKLYTLYHYIIKPKNTFANMLNMLDTVLEPAEDEVDFIVSMIPRMVHLFNSDLTLPKETKTDLGVSAMSMVYLFQKALITSSETHTIKSKIGGVTTERQCPKMKIAAIQFKNFVKHIPDGYLTDIEDKSYLQEDLPEVYTTIMKKIISSSSFVTAYTTLPLRDTYDGFSTFREMGEREMKFVIDESLVKFIGYAMYPKIRSIASQLYESKKNQNTVKTKTNVQSVIVDSSSVIRENNASVFGASYDLKNVDIYKLLDALSDKIVDFDRDDTSVIDQPTVVEKKKTTAKKNNKEIIQNTTKPSVTESDDETEEEKEKVDLPPAAPKTRTKKSGKKSAAPAVPESTEVVPAPEETNKKSRGTRIKKSAV